MQLRSFLHTLCNFLIEKLNLSIKKDFHKYIDQKFFPDLVLPSKEVAIDETKLRKKCMDIKKITDDESQPSPNSWDASELSNRNSTHNWSIFAEKKRSSDIFLIYLKIHLKNNFPWP